MNLSEVVDSRFESVLEIASKQAENLTAGGFSLEIYESGTKKLSFASGTAFPGVPYTPTTLSLAFSCTKGVASILIGMLVDRGLIDFDKPVVQYWPEFSSISSSLTVAEVMQHKAGLSAPRKDMSFEEAIDHQTIIDSLLAQEPLWEPGTAHSYHAFTFGTLLQELAIRVSGKTLGALLQEWVATPLGIEAYIGLPTGMEEKVSPLIALEPYAARDVSVESDEWWQDRALNLGGAFAAEEIGKPEVGFNSPATHRAELPGVNGIFSAHSLAKIWSAVVCETDGVRLLTDKTLSRMTEVAVDEKPFFEQWPWPKRGLGFMLHTPEFRPFLGEGSFGHDGFGGRVGFADPYYKIGFAFTSNRLVQGEAEQKPWLAIAASLREALRQH